MRYAIVTGGASGIGRATALRLAPDGYALRVLDVDLEGALATVQAIVESGGQAMADRIDLTNATEIAPVFDRILAEWGPPAVLVNNAGTAVAATILETDPADWDHILAVNLSALFHTCRAVLPAMIENGGGVIVNVASVAAVVGVARRAAYCASKAGVLGLTRALAADHARQGIRANAICPGTVRTPWIDRIVSASPDPEATVRQMEERQLDGRMGSPEEVAAGIAFLVSPEGRFVNGSAFVMDGGMTAL